MTHEFTLNPDFELLKKYKYLSVKALTQLKLASTIVISIPSIACNIIDLKRERDDFERGLHELADEFQLDSKIKDTLFYICLFEAGTYHSKLIMSFEHFTNDRALKQLGGFLNALATWDDIISISVKSNKKGKSAKIDHKELLQWLPKILASQFYKGNIFSQSTNKQLKHLNNSDWGGLSKITPRSYKQSIGRSRKTFIKKVLLFIQEETNIAPKKFAVLHSEESNFLDRVGQILKVFNPTENFYNSDARMRSILKYNKKSE